jgi:hypothetical protein
VSEPQPAPNDEGDKKEEKPKQSRLHKFVTTYSTFLSSFVIGAAGLVATTIYQSKQQEIARRQAEAQIEISRLNTDNQWKIERAEILAKNLSVLTGSGDNNLDQRYGVLLSLTRGDIIDPELAVSYALELGTHNPDYMRSVLLNVSRKSYLQIAHNFTLTCTQRYGVTRQVPTCRDGDKNAARSQAIAELVSEELLTGNQGPMALLADEDKVRGAARRMAALFEPYLEELYDKRQLGEIERFERASPGARLVAALVLSTDRSGELVSADEAAARKKFHRERQAWLEGYLLGRGCDPDCKGRLADGMLTDGAQAGGAWEQALLALVARPDAERAPAVGRLHGRLLWCQADPEAVARLRDKVLVPGTLAAMKSIGPKPSPDEADRIDDLLGLLALTPQPRDGDKAAFGELYELAKKTQLERWMKGYAARKGAADQQRKSAPAGKRGANFCTAPDAPELDLASDDE